MNFDRPIRTNPEQPPTSSNTMSADPPSSTPAPGITPSVDDDRRKALLLATEIAGGVGLAAAAYPFIASLEPSERARAEGGPVEASWASLGPGQLKTVAWRGKPVWLMRRSPEMVAALRRPNPVLADPDSKRSDQPPACRNATRSIKPELLVAVGICTHLGCSPILKLGEAQFDESIHGPGGFLCPCHGSRFDLAGRVVRNVPAPINLEIPPYTLQTGGRVVIG